MILSNLGLLLVLGQSALAEGPHAEIKKQKTVRPLTSPIDCQATVEPGAQVEMNPVTISIPLSRDGKLSGSIQVDMARSGVPDPVTLLKLTRDDLDRFWNLDQLLILKEDALDLRVETASGEGQATLHLALGADSRKKTFIWKNRAIRCVTKKPK